MTTTTTNSTVTLMVTTGLIRSMLLEVKMIRMMLQMVC